MDRKLRLIAGSAVVAVALAAGTMWVEQGQGEARTSGDATLAGVAASMHFTDGHGNARTPTAEERTALAAAFQADLAQLTRGKKIPSGSTKHPDGSVSAVVGADKLRFLTVQVDAAGNARFGHSELDADGKIVSVDDRPEM